MNWFLLLPAQGHRSQDSDKSTDRLREEMFAGPLYSQISDIVPSEGSVGRTLFGQSGMETLLSEQRDQFCHLRTLGPLMTLERWILILKDLHAEARRRGLQGPKVERVDEKY